jgi:hypothetical protein
LVKVLFTNISNNMWGALVIGFRLRLAFALALLASCVAQAAEIKVESQQAFRDAVRDLEPGDTVVLANGEWRNFEILFTGQGREGRPITLTAEEKGKVLITGQSNLRLAGIPDEHRHRVSQDQGRLRQSFARD